MKKQLAADARIGDFGLRIADLKTRSQESEEREEYWNAGMLGKEHGASFDRLRTGSALRIA